MRSRAADDEPEFVVWRTTRLRLALAVVPLWLTLALLDLQIITWPVKLILAAIFATTLVSPTSGFLIVAALAPLGHLLAKSLGFEHLRLSEAIVVAFIAGWLIRGLPDRRGPGAPAPRVAWTFAAVVAASIAGVARQLHAFPRWLPASLNEMQRGYYGVADRFGLMAGAGLFEGIALVVATVMLFRRRPALANALPAVLAASASLAAVSSLVEWRRVGGYRVSGHVADVNAAGSYFAMALCLSLGMMLRARGHRRVAWAAASLASGIGLWFSESRTAFVMAGLVLLVAATWYQVARWKPAARMAVIGAMLAIGLGVAAVRIHKFNFGVDYRQQFYETSARMIAARPLFGIGVGQYYRTSAMFLSPQLAWNYGFENAHNNFLQIGAELGLAGLGLFIAWIGAGLARTVRALALDPRDTRLLGIACGVVVFIGTWLGSHPLLVSEVAFPFWIQFGLMAALAGSAALNTTGADALVHGRTRRSAPTGVPGDRGRRTVLRAAAACIVVAALVSAWNAPVDLPQSRDVDGFYGWETDRDGTRFRWSGEYASILVPANVTRVYVPVRMPAEARFIPPIEVDVMIGGAHQSRTTIGESWGILNIALPTVDPPARFKRIDFRMDRTWQPALYIPGASEMRVVGLQFGEPKLFHER